jgi:hypothetical protein
VQHVDSLHQHCACSFAVRRPRLPVSMHLDALILGDAVESHLREVLLFERLEGVIRGVHEAAEVADGGEQCAWRSKQMRGSRCEVREAEADRGGLDLCALYRLSMRSSASMLCTLNVIVHEHTTIMSTAMNIAIDTLVSKPTNQWKRAIEGRASR